MKSTLGALALYTQKKSWHHDDEGEKALKSTTSSKYWLCVKLPGIAGPSELLVAHSVHKRKYDRIWLVLDIQFGEQGVCTMSDVPKLGAIQALILKVGKTI